MRIPNNYPNVNGSTDGASTRVHQDQGVAASGNTQVATHTKVSVSPAARRLAAQAGNAEKIERLQHAIDDGSFVVRPWDIAKKLLSDGV